MKNSKLLVVDTDTGVDDALALILLANSPEVTVLAVHSTHGNCTTAQAANNARYVLDTCGREDIPVHMGLHQPLGPNVGVSSGVHGSDGFGNTGLVAARAVPESPNAVEDLIRLAKKHSGELHYLALGPVTNLAAAVRREPDLLDRLKTITIVGSLGPTMYGDREPWNDRRFAVSKDPNMACDLVAAEEIAGSSGAITWCGPYVTRQALVPESVFLTIAEDPGHAPARLIRQISTFYADFYTTSYPQPDGHRVMGINDSLAAACVISPTVITGSVERPMQLFRDSEGRGYIAGVHPSRDDTRPRHRVVFDIDFDRVIDMAAEALEQPVHRGS